MGIASTSPLPITRGRRDPAISKAAIGVPYGDEDEDDTGSSSEKEEGESGNGQSDSLGSMGSQDNLDPLSFLTEEQQIILSHEPSFYSAPVCVNTLVGCGKTTSITMHCNRF